MRPFTFVAARTVAEAVTAGGAAGTKYLTGGATLVDLMKLGVETPTRVVDINALPLRAITPVSGGLAIGGLARLSDVAADPTLAARYPMVTRAVLASATPQLRNMSSVAGNLLQRPRCGYFRDLGTPCARRTPGSECSAVTGYHRDHAILGTGYCLATHASDLAVALVALDAVVRLRDSAGTREVKLADFYRLPGDTPHVENQLRPGELVTAIVLPALAWARRSAYLKIHDRESHQFALASAAVALDVAAGTIQNARVAVGGVATKPWRLPAVEKALQGAKANRASFEAAAALAAEGAKPREHNQFKVRLLPGVIVRALSSLIS